MTKYLPPRSDAQRLSFLQQAAQTAAQDHAAGHTYLLPEMVTALADFLSPFEEAYHQLTQAQSQRSRAVRQQTEAINHLRICLRDFWLALRRRTRRLGHPAEVFQFYGLSLDGRSPTPSGYSGWLAWGEKLVQGESQAVAAGYPAMQNPSAAEVSAALTSAQAAVAAVAVADRVYDQAQEQLAALRGEADRLLAEVMAELRFHLRHQPLPSQRRIMRTYGANFRATKESDD